MEPKRQASGIGHANMGSRKDTLNSLVDLNLKWIAGTGDLHEPWTMGDIGGTCFLAPSVSQFIVWSWIAGS